MECYCLNIHKKKTERTNLIHVQAACWNLFLTYLHHLPYPSMTHPLSEKSYWEEKLCCKGP